MWRPSCSIGSPACRRATRSSASTVVWAPTEGARAPRTTTAAASASSTFAATARERWARSAAARPLASALWVLAVPHDAQGTRDHRRHDGYRPVRPQSHRRAPPRQPPHRAGGVAVRPVDRQRLPGADGGPRPGHLESRPTRRASWPTSRPSGWTGTGRWSVSRSASTATERALDALRTTGLTYECYCTRREIREAAAAPHGPGARYPGTCRTLTRREKAERQREGRPPAIRLRAHGRGGDGPRSAGRRPSPGWSTTSCCGATTACPPTTWPSSSTTPRRAWRRWCGATTCWPPRRARCTSPVCSGWPSRPTPTCPWCWAPTVSGWPSATVP